MTIFAGLKGRVLQGERERRRGLLAEEAGPRLRCPASDLGFARACAREGERKTVLGGDLWGPPKPPEFDPDPRPVAGLPL